VTPSDTIHTSGEGRDAPQEPVIERGDPAELDRLARLWKVLLEDQRAVYAGGIQRPSGDSWRRRRAEYARWLSCGDSFFVVARRGGELLGYAMIQVRQGSPMWDLGERVADLQTLVVVPGERRRHIGRALLDFIDRELERLGIQHVLVEVMAGNAEAVRFYERRGFTPYAAVMHKSYTRRAHDDGPPGRAQHDKGGGSDNHPRTWEGSGPDV
jgi:ribosomal protein S18 acetylase RimI-like enzyme